MSVKGGGPPNSAKEKNLLFRSKNSIFCLFYAFLGLFGPLYGLFDPFLTLFNEKTSLLALIGKNFLEKLSGLSVEFTYVSHSVSKNLTPCKMLKKCFLIQGDIFNWPPLN